MAVDTPLLRERQVFGFKVETTTGTAESITAAEATTNIFEPEIQPDVQYNDRQAQGALSPMAGRTGPHGATVRFQTEVVGKGSSGVPSWVDLLLCAGFELSTGQTYAVSTDNMNTTTITAGHFIDGQYYAATGVKLDMTMTGTIGAPVRCAWNGRGKWVAPTAASLILPTYSTTVAPVLESATFTIASTAYRISNFELALGNNVVPRQDITDATGYHAFAITRRRVTFRCDPEQVALGTKNWYTDLTSHTEAALSLVIGGTSNNIMTIACPKLQLTGVQTGTRDGILTAGLTFVANRSAAAGDDELTIAFS